MFEIDRLHIITKLEDKKISEYAYFAIFGNNAMKFKKKLFIVKEEEEVEDHLIDIYNQHLIEARAISLKKHLIDIEKNIDSHIKSNSLIKEDEYDSFVYKKSSYRYSYYDTDDTDDTDEKIINNYIQTAIHFLDSEFTKQSMMELDKLAYFKAQKLFWEEKINDELSKREQEQIDEESKEGEE